MFFTRLITAAILFFVLFCVFYLGSAMFVGVEVGLETVAKQGESQGSPANLDQVKAEAKQEAREKVEADIGTIVLVAVVLSGLCSLGLAFGGVLPWCRKKRPAVAGHSSGEMPDNVAVAVGDQDEKT